MVATKTTLPTLAERTYLMGDSRQSLVYRSSRGVHSVTWHTEFGTTIWRGFHTRQLARLYWRNLQRSIRSTGFVDAEF